MSFSGICGSLVIATVLTATELSWILKFPLKDVYFETGCMDPKAIIASFWRSSGDSTGAKFRLFVNFAAQIKYWCLHGEPSCPLSQLQTPIEMSTKNLLFKKHNYLRKKTAKRLFKEIPTVLRRNWQQQPVTI